MNTIHANHTHFSIRTALRPLRIPTRWRAATDLLSGERILVPAVHQRVGRELTEIREPWNVRKRFLKMRLNESSALDFLSEVGVWTAIEDYSATREKRDLLIAGAFGRRYFVGYTRPISLQELTEQQQRWSFLLSSQAKLRSRFTPLFLRKPRPIDKLDFALRNRFGNTLPIHLQFIGNRPEAIIQPISGDELLTALGWLDLVTEAAVKTCANVNCQVQYTVGGRKYCNWTCEHATNVRNWRRRNRETKRKRKSLR